MTETAIFLKNIEDHKIVLEKLISEKNNIEAIIKRCEKVLEKSNKFMFCGNGGSAADSQHLAAEFTGRFIKRTQPLPALALTTDTSALTAIGNDFGFDKVFSRQISALGSAGDVLFAISTSGNSKNILEAVEEAKKRNIYTVGLIGNDGGELAKIADQSIIVSSAHTARIQEMHILIGHIICEALDNYRKF